MHRRTGLLAICGLAVVLSCESDSRLTAPKSPTDPNKIIQDGAHGGNKDFFFLPPMVPLPLNNPDFELGKFNNALKSSLKIDICELKAENLNPQGLPTAATGCVAGAPVKSFAPGSVQLVNLPLKQTGWWTLFNLPPDGFYYVLWDTRQSNLNVNKYYRIKVFVDGSSTPLGVADVDPMANISQWKYTLTGQVIQLVDDVMLPISFRVEKGALCEGGNCTSVTVSNNSPTGSQTVTVEGGAGSIAGASFPNGWLPASGPQSVVVTIAEVATAGGGAATGDQTQCHVGLALQQFRGCFSFTTTPALQPINERGDEFAQAVTVAVCYELQGSGDPREKFAELWSSGPNEPPHPLDDASDLGLLGPAARNCSTTQVIGQASSNPLVRFASSGYRKVKSGLGALFGVKTAYAVDLGLGGLAYEFSHVSPVLSARIQAYTSTSLTNLGAGATTTSTARIVGNDHHTTHTLATGLGGLPVTFTVAPGNGTLLPLGSEGTGVSQVTVTTNTNPIDGSPTSGGGFAPVNWTMPTPTAPGTYTYTLTANGPALGGPVVFTSTVVVPANLPDLTAASNFTLSPVDFTGSGGRSLVIGTQFSNVGASFSPPAGVNSIGVGFYVSDDPVITTADRLIGTTSVDPSSLAAEGSVVGPSASLVTMPALTPGTHYFGVLIDPTNIVNEGTNEGNNFGAIPFTVFDGLDFETYPGGGAVCNGQLACDVTNEFASRGVTFSSTTPGLNASLCRTRHGPVGEGSNYGVSDPANSDCSGWTNSGIVMTFSNQPKSVQLQVEVNIQAGLQVTALDVAGNPVGDNVLINSTYDDGQGNFFHRVVFIFASTVGIQSVTVAQSSGVHIIDNLIIKP